MAIGPALQEARLKKQLTTSQVAELTRMKMQIVDDLEHDDFHRIAATIYGKGFIKLFAECVGLDPAPLIADYMLTLRGGSGAAHSVPTPPAGKVHGSKVHGGKVRGDAAPHAAPPPPPPPPPPAPEPEPELDPEPEDLFAFANSQRKRITPDAPRLRGTTAFSPPPPPASPSGTVKHRTRAGQRNLAVVAAGIFRNLRRQVTLLAEAGKERLANLKWGDRFLKILGIALAAIALILVLTAIIRHLAARSGTRPPADHELILLTKPPEPYVD
jgi:hypothetical protein